MGSLDEFSNQFSKECKSFYFVEIKKLENKKLSKDIDYKNIEGLRIEAREKLSDIRPESIGQASRITGVSPADINVLLIYLEQKRRKNEFS